MLCLSLPLDRGRHAEVSSDKELAQAPLQLGTCQNSLLARDLSIHQQRLLRGSFSRLISFIPSMSCSLCLTFFLAGYRPSITFPPGLSCHCSLRGKWPSSYISGPFCHLATPLSSCLSFIILITWMLSCTRLFPYFDLVPLHDFIVVLLQHQMVLLLDGLFTMKYLQS